MERPWSKAVIGHAGFATWVDRFSFSLLFSRNNRFEWMEPCIPRPNRGTVVDFWAGHEATGRRPASFDHVSFIDHVARELITVETRRFLFFLRSHRHNSLYREIFFRDSRSRAKRVEERSTIDKRRGKRDVYLWMGVSYQAVKMIDDKNLLRAFIAILIRG